MKLLLKNALIAAIGVAVIGLGSPANALITGTLTAPGNKCLAGKIKCVIKKKACLLGCYAKAGGAGAAVVDVACAGKCHDKFDGGTDPTKGCFAKLEAKGGCLTDDDTPSIEQKIDGYVLDATAQLSFPDSVANGKCLAAKIKALNGYNKCVLGVYAKAGGGGLAADQVKVGGCATKMTGAFGKADGKPPCATPPGDAQAVINADNLFIDDVLAELGGDLDIRRCTGDTKVSCTVTADCAGPGGTCENFFGGPLPLSAGGVATCVLNQWNGTISGTANQGTGASAGTAAVIARVFTGPITATPCPRCVGDGLPNDGVAGGTCDAGPHSGQACDSTGISPVPSFGATSMDCPPSPGNAIGALPVDLTNTNTGSSTLTLAASSPNCNSPGFAGFKCACGVCSGNTQIPCKNTAECTLAGAGTCGFTAGEPSKPNACVDDTSIAGLDCVASGGGEGNCSQGPIDTTCAIDTWKGCITNADCPVTGDFCQSSLRDCFTDNGVVGGTIVATGTTTTPVHHGSRSTFASTFCIAVTGSTSVNSVAGLPGPGRLQLGGVAQENGDATTCPTQFTFLPTSKGGVLDTGWTGIAHDATVVSSGKVTVNVTACQNASPPCGVCTYTGPAQNANIN